VLATDVDGVWDDAGRLIASMTDARAGAAAGDAQDDVTGAMSAKVDAALEIAATGARTTIVNGRIGGRVLAALLRRSVPGTEVLCQAPAPATPIVSGP
jgi:isopentenyl phosphate kinase